MTKVQWHDVQGLVRSGYPHLERSAFLLWQLPEANLDAVQDWLAGLVRRIMRADEVAAEDVASTPDSNPAMPNLKALKRAVQDGASKGAFAINVALTATGLSRLARNNDELRALPAAFLEGMAPVSERTISRRSQSLGDVGDNAPQHWTWGASHNPRIDGLLLIYALDDARLQALVASETASLQRAGVTLVPPQLAGWTEKEPREHFGFRDGISQPIIAGTKRADDIESARIERISVVKPGEFVLGYENERGQSVDTALLRNGTFLVLRDLEQDVAGFKAFLKTAAQQIIGTSSESDCEWIAARMLGRYRSGVPLVPASTAAAAGDVLRNDFLYGFEDPSGLACPLGAHIRRANPRDSLGPNPDTALRLSKMHRIIRRSRLFGNRLQEVEEAQTEAQTRRGMYFMALNADIAGQFEMIQHSWINNTHFLGLHGEADPIGHYRMADGMTIQSRPAHARTSALPRFVTVRGGAYFFLPGLRQLSLLATSAHR